MALYQPTNIYPDLKGGVQNGVILLPYSGTINDVEVSWTVNGNSPMTDYKIDFYTNDAASTLTGTTGKVTLGTPFSAVSADGTEQRFSVNVAYSLFSGTFAGATKRQGKFKITMWWGSGANDYVEQRSLSVFEVSMAGQLYLNTPVESLGNFTFSGGYNAPPADTPEYTGQELNWTKWTIFAGSPNGEVVQTTGKVWGATSYEWSPSTLYFGYYYVSWEAEQSNGALLSVGSSFDVTASGIFFMNNAMELACDHSKDAIRVKANDIVYIAPKLIGEIEPYYVFKIPSGLQNVMPWSFIWHGTIEPYYPMFVLRCANGDAISAYYTLGTNNMSFSINTTEENPGQWTITNLAEAYVCFTSGNFYAGTSTGFQFVVYNKASGSTPNNAGVFSAASYAQSPIVEVLIHKDVFDNWFSDFTIGFGPNNDAIKAGYQDASVAATFSGAKIYEEKGQNNNRAVVYYFGGAVSEYYLYRKEGNESVVKLVGAFLPNIDPSFEHIVYDYSAVSGKTYDYYIYSTLGSYNEDNYPIRRVRNVRPCFYNHDLIVAKKAAVTDPSLTHEIFYEAVTVFHFAGNTSIGSYSNGGTRNVQSTFTPYPTIMKSTQNRRQGTLTGLLSVWSNNALDFGAPGAYSDTNNLEAALRWLSTMPSDYMMFLKDKRGNFMKVALSGEITLQANGASSAQEITASVPWVEVGEATETVFGDEWRFIPV